MRNEDVSLVRLAALWVACWTALGASFVLLRVADAALAVADGAACGAKRLTDFATQPPP